MLWHYKNGKSHEPLAEGIGMYRFRKTQRPCCDDALFRFSFQ